MSGSGNDGTDDVSLLIKLFSGISKVAIHHLDFAIQVLKLVVLFLNYMLLDQDDPADEILVGIFMVTSLLL